MSLPSCLHGHVEQYNVVKLLPNTDYGDMNHDVLSDSRSLQVYWSRCELSVFHYDFEAGVGSIREVTIGWGRKCQDDGAVLTDRKLPVVPKTFVDGRAMSMPESISQVYQYLVAPYPANLAKSTTATLKEVAYINLLACDLDC